LKTNKLNKLLISLNAEPVAYTTKVGEVKLVAPTKKELLDKLVIYQIPSPFQYRVSEEELPKVVLSVEDNELIVDYGVIDLATLQDQYEWLEPDELELKEEPRVSIGKQQFTYSPITLQLVHKQLKRVGWIVELMED